MDQKFAPLPPEVRLQLFSETVPAAAVMAAVKAEEKIARALEGKTLVKEIFVPNKLVNLVVR